MKKKLLLLGGLRYLIPVIKSAHEQGYYVITCDYLPNNIAHKYSDEYINASITDKEAILKIAIDKQIDGIMSLQLIPGFVASYVAEKWVCQAALINLFKYYKIRCYLGIIY